MYWMSSGETTVDCHQVTSIECSCSSVATCLLLVLRCRQMIIDAIAALAHVDLLFVVSHSLFTRGLG